MDNATAESILTVAGKSPYKVFDWQLVQTHIIHEDGSIEELWRPGHNTGSDDPVELNKALEAFIQREGLTVRPPIPMAKNPRLAQVGEDGLALRVILRYPRQETFPRNHHYTMDWILFSSDQLSSILPPVGAEGEVYEIAPAVARDVLAHFRPYLDSGVSEAYGVHDPHAQAVRRTTAASLRGRSIETSPTGTTTVALSGSIRMENLGEPVPEAPSSSAKIEDQKWVTIRSVDVTVTGFVKLDANTRVVQDMQLILETASLVTPSGAVVEYKGMARKMEPIEG